MTFYKPQPGRKKNLHLPNVYYCIYNPANDCFLRKYDFCFGIKFDSAHITWHNDDCYLFVEKNFEPFLILELAYKLFQRQVYDKHTNNMYKVEDIRKWQIVRVFLSEFNEVDEFNEIKIDWNDVMELGTEYDKGYW